MSLCLSYSSSQNNGNFSNTTDSEGDYTVIIVGAGPSGVAAAVTLLENNITNFIILEASDRIGGRIHTSKFGDDVIEYGAQFVHGEKNNSVFEMSRPYDLLVSYSRYKNLTKFYNGSGDPVDTNCVFELINMCEGIINEINPLKFNGSVAEFFKPRYEATVAERGVDPILAQSVLDLFIKHENSYDGTDSLSEIGPRGITEYWECEGDLTLSWANKGYCTVFELLTHKYPSPENELPVVNKTIFGKLVSNVDWSSGEIGVHSHDGTFYTADYVIVTSSLGYLKNNYKSMFTPHLHADKVTAIQSIGFGTVNKIFLLFPERWWPKTSFSYSFLWTDVDKENYYNTTSYGKWPVDISGFYFVENQPRLLCAWISGSAAREMERKSDTDVINATMDLLRRFLGDNYSIPEPEAMTRSKWNSNPLTRGSYSFLSLESERLKATAADLAEPLVNGNNKTVVLFAGEATHSHYFSTVHGAIDTGRREATRLLNLING